MAGETINPAIEPFVEILEIKRGRIAKKIADIHQQLENLSPNHLCLPWCMCRRLTPLRTRLLDQQQQIATAESDLLNGDTTSSINLVSRALRAAAKKPSSFEQFIFRLMEPKLTKHTRQKKALENLPLLITDIKKYGTQK